MFRSRVSPSIIVFPAALPAQPAAVEPLPAGLSPQMRLSQFHRRWFVPNHCRSRRLALDPKTEAEYDSAVAVFIACVGDLPLVQITNQVCATFVELDLARPGKRPGELLSARTCRKHCIALNGEFCTAGPRSREHRDTATEDGLFGLDRHGRPREAPWFPPIHCPDHAPQKVCTVEEIECWLRACDGALQPILSGCTAGQWWRSLVLFIYNSGLRIGTTMQLRREWLHQDGLTHWADIPAAAYKQHRSKLIYLSPAAIAAIEALPTGPLVFPWPYTPKHLQWYRLRLQRQAGLPQDRCLGFHALRAANITETYSFDPRAAQEQAGHESIKTTIGSYVAPRAIVQAKAARIGPALAKIRQPRPAPGQLNLF